MKTRILISFVIVTVVSACASAPQVTVTPQATVTLPPTSTPEPTFTPEPQLPEELTELQKSLEETAYALGLNEDKSAHVLTYTDPETKEKSEIEGIAFDNTGKMTITHEGQEFITNANAIYILNNQDQDVLQIRDEANQKVLFAFDQRDKKFLEASKYVQLDRMNVEGYIRVDDMAGLDELARITEMLSMPFPENTYFPPIDVVNFEYANRQDPNFGYPFGEFPEGMVSFLRIANFVIVGTDPENGRPYESAAVLQHAYNADDKTFGTIKYVRDILGPERETSTAIQLIQEKADGSNILLPHTGLDSVDISHPGRTTIKKYYEDGGKYLKILVKKWFQDQHIPAELSAGAWDLTKKFWR